MDQHRLHVKQVLSKLRQYQLFTKLEKCEFEVQKVSLLEYIISSDGFLMDPSKVQAVLEWVRPTNLKAIQRFLGFANYYRRFIHSFSDHVAPLTALTHKGADATNWSSDAITSFEALKSAFASALVLRHPNP
ncbi:uncharacterized protein LOC142150711 [Mixophyes fleayi]|uniref:uncharacterized protein LOC142150711 n=1 Tax=Mixophyes fleayi TaxID=3061075 RepID=UPI003F4E267B